MTAQHEADSVDLLFVVEVVSTQGRTCVVMVKFDANQATIPRTAGHKPSMPAHLCVVVVQYSAFHLICLRVADTWPTTPH